MLLGAHQSIEGGFDRAPLRGRETGCTSLQIFVKSSSQWRARPITSEETEAFQNNCRASRIAAIVAHSSYLINLGARDQALWRRSIEACADELRRCAALGIPGLILHPGAHKGAGEEEGLKRIAGGLDQVLEDARDLRVQIILEATAGQGTVLGYRFEHLARLFELVQRNERLGVCLDTCHLFAAGYDLRTEKGYERAMESFDQIVGFQHLKVLHLNDSKKPLGSRVDRHEHIGKGFLGLQAFRLIMQDDRMKGLPMILETPKEPDPVKNDRRNLTTLKRLGRRHRP
ncbi:MAG: deoxyribonuclease IV [candidate division NC10 bacterium]|nr:deoxyribonuclease IV [candidate division NC10 bacterium]